MGDPFPPEIEVTETPGGVHYRLPRRSLGNLRYLGLALIVFGAVLGVAGAGGPSAVVLLFGLGLPPPGNILFAAFAGLIAFLPLVFAFRIIRTGAIVYAGHSEIILDGGRLDATERAGPFRWTQRRAVADVWRLTVTPQIGRGDARSEGPTLPGKLVLIRALCEGGKPLLLAVAYPRDWVLPLANDLARRCRLATEVTAGAQAPAGPVVEEEGLPTPAAGAAPAPAVPHETPRQPRTSRATLQEDAEGLTLMIPPAGVWHGSKGLFLFALMWCSFLAVISTLFILFTLAGGMAAPLCLVIPFLSVFWLVGVGMLLAAVNMGRRRAVLAVVGPTLMVLQTGLFGGTKREWSREQLAGIRVGPSGTVVNNVPVLDLQIHATDGSKVGLLAGHDEAELEWLAAVLRNALALGEPAGGAPK
jgi:hypothetical protein